MPTVATDLALSLPLGTEAADVDILNTALTRVGIAASPWVNVKAPGSGTAATGDGTTNDTTAIHAARDRANTLATAAGVAGGTLVFPAGNYSVAGLVANVANQTWILLRGAKLTLRDASEVSVVRVTAANVRIEGFGAVIDGNESGQATGVSSDEGSSGVGCHGVKVESVAGVTVRGLTFQNTKHRAVSVNTGSYCAVENCRAESTTLGFRMFDACTDCTFRGLVNLGQEILVDGRAAYGPDSGREAWAAAGSPAESGKGNSHTCRRVRFIDCRCEGSSGMQFNNVAVGEIVGCHARNSGDYGIDLEHCTLVTVQGCTAIDCTNAGIALYKNNDSCTVTGNIAQSNDGQGIMVGANGVTDAGTVANPNRAITVVGNVCKVNGGHGILVTESGSVVLGFNVCEENANSGICVSGVNTGHGQHKNVIGIGNYCANAPGVTTQQYGIKSDGFGSNWWIGNYVGNTDGGFNAVAGMLTPNTGGDDVQRFLNKGDTGGSYAQILTAQASDGQVPAATVQYLGVGFDQLSSTGALGQFAVPRACTVRNLRAVTSTAQPGTGSLVVTIRKNGVGTSVLATVAAGAGAGTASDTTHSVDFAAGDLLDISVSNNAPGTAAAKLRGVSFELS